VNKTIIRGNAELEMHDDQGWVGQFKKL